jgi:phosphoribosylformylglycinamidine cyclo-ligase
MDYKTSGVDIDAGNKAVQLIKNKVKETYNSNVLASIGGFAAFYELPKYKNPVLVSCTDGVGTKLKLAIDLGIFNTVGIDLVAMSVNDLICCGARPLFFLDYIACHKNIPEQMKEIVDGIVDGCKQSDAALIGGEMAEMNDLYKEGDFDLAGFAVGVVEKDERIDGTKVKSGDYVYGFASSGIHSNGYSLVRKVLTEEACKKAGIDQRILLEPTRIYVKEVMKLVEKGGISAIAHITGGGLQENLARVIPDNVKAIITEEKIKIPQIFTDIAEIGNISKEEMFRVFNMGIGMIIVSSEKLEENNDFYFLGTIEEGRGEVDLI